MTYYYCNPISGLEESRNVTMVVGTESTYFNETSGYCTVTKKRRKITMNLSSSAPVSIICRYSYTYSYENLYVDDAPTTYTVTDTINIPAGSTSAYKYVDTYIRSMCTQTDGTDNPYVRVAV